MSKRKNKNIQQGHREARGSLAHNAIAKAVPPILAITILVCSISFYLVRNNYEDELLDGLRSYMEQRIDRESRLFDDIRQLHESARAEFIRRLDDPAPTDLEERFDQLFPLMPDGTRRSNPLLFDGMKLADNVPVRGFGAFISDGRDLSLNDKKNLLTVFYIVRDFGYTNLARFSNFYFFTPDNKLLILAPDREDKLLFYRQDAPADFNYYNEEVNQITLPENNPGRTTQCTSLQPIIYDQTDKTWTTGCMTPMDINGKHIGAWGSSILLNELLDHAILERLPEARNMIITDQGKLIAHPDITYQGDQSLIRHLDIPTSSNDYMKAVFQKVREHGKKKVFLIDNREYGEYISAGYIEGPGWYFLTSLPARMVSDHAFTIAFGLLLIGLFAILATSGVIYFVVKNTIVRPVSELAETSNQIALGRFIDLEDNEELSKLTGRSDEIGGLANDFNAMALQLKSLFQSLEDKVEKRTTDLNKAKKEAERANRAKSAFLANMSHEIRTPLNGIIGILDILEKRNLDDQTRHYVETAEHSSRILLDLINDILDLTRLEAGKLQLHNSSVNLGEVTADILKGLAIQAENKKLELAGDVSNSSSFWVKIDAKAYRQILLNLVGNAIKFTEDGQIAVSLAMEDLKNGTVRAVLSVRDTGIGISEEDLPRLFDRFEQVTAHHEHKYQGTGLGLAICHQLVELMSGTIRAESMVDQGSIFTVEFVLDIAKAPANANSRKRQDQDVPPDLKILAVDDNQINRMIIEKMCQSLKMETAMASGGQEAIDIVRKTMEAKAAPFDLLLLDISMPDKDGPQTLAEIRCLGDWAVHVPAIALTAHSLDGDRERFLLQGMAGYVAKPVDLKLLASEIRNVLQKPAKSRVS
ncbi:ATP-binding protein [Emcibacter sp.]|uniref:ATP-binding protein n=1 Tax=Emcibacter sp. TaxID=1979954 RepID=UPI003A90CB30